MQSQAAIGIIVLVIVTGGFILLHDLNDRIENAPEDVPSTQAIMKLTSSAFEHEGDIPSKYTCDVERTLNPPLSISGVPEQARSLVLLVDDPDIPQQFKDERGIDAFDHWIVFNIAPTQSEIGEGTSSFGTMGSNSRGERGYTGPCPPTEFEPTEHRYIFALFALDTELSLAEGATKAEVEAVMEDHVLEETVLIGRYDRNSAD